MELHETARVAELYVYPIKGLSPQPLTHVPLRRGEGFPHDREFALARPGGKYRPGLREGLRKTEFYALVSDHRLAGLHTHLDVGTGELTVRVAGHEVLTAHLEEDREELLAFFARVLDLPEGVLPVPAAEEGRRFTDVASAGDGPMHWVSLLNLASVRDFAERTGAEVDPRRFRANVLLDGLPPFGELDLLDREFTLGGVRMIGRYRTGRCAATEVDPVSGRRDLPVLRLLDRTYGHQELGIYAEVLSDGVLSVGGGLGV
ncbi:MOSC domain-containing protein [Saccharothrix sp. Mg75]|uniref:MOSC domain-containing protein n=1 Tax=Saccharothrix sp. Mg75 TaxID=3445357 RepID=UPI003EEE607E